MASKQMSTPGAPAASRTKRSPLAPNGKGPVNVGFDDVSAKVVKGTMRPRGPSGVGGNDAALGRKGVTTRTSTNASAQFRITAKMPGGTEPAASKNLANSPILPAVMGEKQSMIRGMQNQGR